MKKMRVFTDLHIHSHYSRATSREMNIRNLEKFSKLKGLSLIGTGDFTHPHWLEELKGSLRKIEGSGLFYFRDPKIFFMLQTEVSNIFEQGGKIRKVHNVILAPSFEIVEQINEFLGKYGNLSSDGRPILNLNCVELVEKLIGISKDVMIIPAHAWTPWYGILGSKSGFDSIEECFEDQTKNIFAIETGLSSDPPMNWRLSSLDKFTLVSNSDSHSPWPHRLGREANVFELEKMTYWEIINAIKEKDKKRFLYTVEVDPRYGKYHNNGHRLCNINLIPAETKRFKGFCPKCVKGDTIILGDNKPISQVNVGNNFIGMNGCEKIKKIFTRNYKGKIIQIDAWGLLPIEVTPEHPILVTTSQTKDLVINRFSELYWKEARNIVPKHGHKNGDYVIVPRIKGIINIKEIDLKPFTTEHRAKIARGKNLSLSFPLNKNTAWLLGLYVAEGSCQARRDKNGFEVGGIVFSLGKHEKKIQNHVCKIIKSLGYSPCVSEKKLAVKIITPSMILNRAFSTWCGRDALNKKVPDFILLHKDLSLVKAFLDGYIAGDGCAYRGAVWAECVSLLLALQLQILCARLGKFLHISSKPPRRERFQERKVNRHKSYVMHYNINDTQFQVKIFNTFIITPVRKVNVTFYNKKVYNIETSDNTYLVSNAVVHNCGRKLTLGVLHRVEELADREEGFIPKNAIPFKTLLPLSELIAYAYNTQAFSKKVWSESTKLVKEFGSEFDVLLDVDENELKKVVDERIVDLIIKNRRGKIKIQPGYDGVYGRIVNKISTKRPQRRIDNYINK